MLRIISHIERLLLLHDCVIVPGFGGFVLQNIPAVWEKEEHTFIPAKKEISFNETLSHSDGLLAESYMQLYHIDYEKAQQMLKEDVADMKKDLQQYHKLSMGVIGLLSLGSEGQILFTPSDTKLFSINSFGLTDLHILPLSIIQQNQENKNSQNKYSKHPSVKNDILYIPVNLKFIRLISAAAIAIIAFLIVSTPIKEVNKEAYRASFIPYEIVQPKHSVPTEKEKSPIIIEKESTTECKKIEIITPTPTNKVVEKKNDSETVTNTKKKTIPTEKVVTPLLKVKMYHAIIASFPDKKQANKYLQSINRDQFPNADIIFRNEKYRIFAQRFTNKEEASAYINKLHNNKKYSDAWLFISR